MIAVIIYYDDVCGDMTSQECTNEQELKEWKEQNKENNYSNYIIYGDNLTMEIDT